ncbi:MAG: ribbon-helix-helix protein, CopG family [Deltaproteobacteria bacterium]|nr:ribbon-helix-helix protein, CopG family [Deltaproteobacteria bacterium]MBI3387403.1 ribbon-helix-helix protein, CopG family [Deltaproteobacteria bacterium]
MKPLQVYVDETDLKQLEAWARERQWTKSQAIRAAIRALTRSGTKKIDPLLEMSGMIIDDLPADASEKFDHYLQNTFVAERAPIYPKRRRPRTRPRR